ncbi:MAG: dockerin type I domain-containing protein, partial [Pirellulales bacterium]
ALGGSFLRAFAFPGGLYINTPSSRPASTIAHESGHMFWTFDEYAGGDLYTARRGYYLTQNTNAAGNRTPGFVQEPSIMASGDLMQQSWDQKTLPASTKALIGWKDSDGDGIFDVLDVPLELDGTGAYETATGNYRFRGSARPGTLPNKNNEGMGNDISLNKISRIEARFDGGNWFTVASPDSYTPDLDLNIPLTSGALEIEIRAVSLPTGVTSNVFKGRIARADAVTTPGINGFVWLDNNKNGLQDVGEYGEAGWKIEVLSSTGQTLNLHRVVEPDTFTDGPLASTAVPGISIRSVGTDADGRVGVFGDSIASTGTKTFRGYSRQASSWMSTWSDSARRMQVDFGTPTSIVQIDVLGVGADAYGKMEAFDSDGNLIDRTITSLIPNNGITTMQVVSPTAKIAYVQIGSQGYGNVRLDNLRYGPETTTLTQAYGKYTVPYLPSGNYIVRATSPNSGAIPLTSGADSRTATATLGQVTNDVDFAFKAAVSDWQNPRNRFDVSNDGFVTPMDALILINELNQRGPHSLLPSDVPPPYFDVSGDGYISPLDALLVINYLNNSVGGSGEGESLQPDARPQATEPDGLVVQSETSTPVVTAGTPSLPASLACDPWSAGSPHSDSEGEQSAAATDAVFADDWLLTWLGPSPMKSRRGRS